MLTTTKTISFNGMSTVEVDGSVKTVAYFNAQVQSDGKHNINKSVQDEALYKANKAAVKKDYDEFEGLVEKMTD